MKKIGLICAGLLLCGSLSACGNQSNKSASSSSKDNSSLKAENSSLKKKLNHKKHKQNKKESEQNSSNSSKSNSNNNQQQSNQQQGSSQTSPSSQGQQATGGNSLPPASDLHDFVNRYGESPAAYLSDHYGMSPEQAVQSVPNDMKSSGEIQDTYQLQQGQDPFSN